jgi:predicted RNA-binding Zn-ribbon protein involved in translation (DUF1610 family)
MDRSQDSLFSDDDILEILGGPCAHRRAFLAVAGRSNGVGFWCPECEAWVTRALGHYSDPFLPKQHEALRGIDRRALPRVHQAAEKCAICGMMSTIGEEHHWCPEALYRDHPPPHGGPSDFLCSDCHKEWHQRVTPNLGKR